MHGSDSSNDGADDVDLDTSCLPALQITLQVHLGRCCSGWSSSSELSVITRRHLKCGGDTSSYFLQAAAIQAACDCDEAHEAPAGQAGCLAASGGQPQGLSLPADQQHRQRGCHAHGHRHREAVAAAVLRARKEAVGQAWQAAGEPERIPG
jgi:hypothetical protein